MIAPRNVAKTTIKILGIGGAGCNTINKLLPIQKPNWELYAVNTDQKSLARNKATNKIHLGTKDNVNDIDSGARGIPENGKLAAEQSTDELTKVLKNSTTVFLLAGLGGGTGSGATPVIAKLAKDLGLKTISIVTMPFEHEGPNRKDQAQDAIKKLKKIADVTKVIENESINNSENKTDDFVTAFDRIDQAISDEIMRHL